MLPTLRSASLAPEIAMMNSPKLAAALNWQKHFELSFDPDTARRLP
jgi:thiamine biosynthesis protein ThiC